VARSSNRLPRGTATFLFTDIEVETEGDGFFAAFASAVGAVAACVDAQRSLAVEPWDADREIRVRMGLHTGDARVHGDGYEGVDVHRAARVAAAAHGGQVLLSDRTRVLVEDELADGVELQDMGEHRLKGLIRPERLFQLRVEGLRVDFPPVRSLDVIARNLPRQVTSFVGREAERAAIADRLLQARFVTLTGPGGVGKTRLAIAVAEDVAGRFGGLWFVDLTPARDADAVLGITSAVLDVAAEPGRTALESLTTRLAHARALVVFDNCEQVLDPVSELVTTVLGRASRLCILATSRESIGAPGEVVVPISPLDETDAVRLFVQRAATVDPRFALGEENAAAVASICRRLDGIPLALELTAAHAHGLGPGQIDARLDDRFSLLRAPARGRDQRHQTLEAVLGWSYDLLDDVERAALDRLAVFRGTFSLEAAERVVADDPVDRDAVLHVVLQLVRKSLLVAEGGGAERRYRLLETVREYGWRRLASARVLDRRRDRHFEWVMELADRAIAGLAGPEQVRWLDALDEELDNIEAALGWSLRDAARAARSLHAVTRLYPFWLARGTRRLEGVKWSEATAAAAVELDGEARTGALLSAVLLVVWSDLDAADALGRAAVRLAEDDPLARAHAELALVWPAVFRGDPTAPGRAERAAEVLGAGDAFHLWALAAAGMARRDGPERAHEIMVAAAQGCRSAGDEHLYGAWLSFAADFAAVAGDSAVAAREAREALAISRRFSCASCESQACASLALVDPAEQEGGPLKVARRGVELAHGIHEVFNVLCNLEVVAGALADDGRPEDALRLAAAGASLRRATRFAPILPGRAARAAAGVARARTALDPGSVEELLAEGERLDYEAAVALALGGSAGSS
jgi:predicted ATPase